MVEFELDGKSLNVEEGKTILEVALQQGKYIPHFCYHKKLSIAANCRMCLVEVEKSAKPLPACATPITDGMKVHTHSKLAIEAQHGVMEFLLINHPLDCPICDQGGECQLQDLAVGYGRSTTRFTEEKRVVTNKDLGPLVTTEMTRCIHCSRCVRFTDEIAGLQELGMSYRNNHVEVMPFIGHTVNSELSGNIIDICPVGALTSKPFSHQYRSWELSRRKSIAAHDSMGSNIIVQVDKYHKVVRVLPLENEAINECWLSDRDRFSYEGLYHRERLATPLIKQNGSWQEVDWETALSYVAQGISNIKNEHGADAIGVLAHGSSTVEELYLLQKLMRKLNINNLDHRLKQSDFSLDRSYLGAQYLGATLEQLMQSKALLVIGSNVRQEQPLLAHRVRKMVKNGCKLSVINVIKENLLCALENQITCDPREIVNFLAQVVKASFINNPQLNISDCKIDLTNVTVTEQAMSIVKSFAQGGHVILGEVAHMLPNYGQLVILTEQLAKNLNIKFGVLNNAANSVGAALVGFVPHALPFNQQLNSAKTDEQGSSSSAMDALAMLANPRKAYVLFNTELELDSANSAITLAALQQAESVVVMSAFINDAMREYADVILPISPYTETAGSYVNAQGMWQKFNGVTRPLHNARPGWKVLRVLANHLLPESTEFNYDSIEDVRQELAPLNDLASLLNNATNREYCFTLESATEHDKLVRIGLDGMYSIDSITRRAQSLQQTRQAQAPILKINSKLAEKLKVAENSEMAVMQERIQKRFNVAICNSVPDNAVLLLNNDKTCGIGGRFATIYLNPL